MSSLVRIAAHVIYYSQVAVTADVATIAATDKGTRLDMGMDKKAFPARPDGSWDACAYFIMIGLQQGAAWRALVTRSYVLMSSAANN